MITEHTVTTITVACSENPATPPAAFAKFVASWGP